MKFLCEQCKAKYQIADEKAAGKTVRMKCRKCGYLIEVRAAATETGAAASPAPAGTRTSKPPPPAGGASRPIAPRAPLATSLAAARPQAKPAGPLASALRTAIQRDDEVSAPIDMSDLSPSDEWYVAINGVPVGPIRMAEVRRKAAIGAVTEESLCWQEGLDEWRPLRSFPELAAIVREAFVSGRSSLTPPPPDGRHSLPPQAGRASMRPAASPGGTPRPPPARTGATSPPPPAARNNVVPITSRLATAEKLAEEPDDLTRPFTGSIPGLVPTPGKAIEPSVVPDPFAPPPAPRPAAGMQPAAAPAADPFAPYRSGSGSASIAPLPLTPSRKGPPWMVIAMLAAATAFGITAGLAVFLRPPPAPAPVVAQAPGAPATLPATSAAAVGPTANETPEPTATTAPTVARPVAASGPRVAAASTATAAPAHGPLDLHGLTGSTIAPTEDPGGGDSPKAPGQCLSEGQIRQVIGLHSVGLRRSCWERSSSQKLSANVTVSLTVGADGSPQGVSASGDDPAVASCIANDVKGWRFPPGGCSQPTAIPFHFVRQ